MGTAVYRKAPDAEEGSAAGTHMKHSGGVERRPRTAELAPYYLAVTF